MSTRPHSPSLHRLTFVSARNQDLVADYLAHLRTRHYSPKTLQTTLGALVTFYRLLPPARQPSLWQDVTRLTPADVDAWLEAAQRNGLAPSTIHSLLSVVRRFCTFLQEHGLLAHQPIHPRRHAVLLPQMLPRTDGGGRPDPVFPGHRCAPGSDHVSAHAAVWAAGGGSHERCPGRPSIGPRAPSGWTIAKDASIGSCTSLLIWRRCCANGGGPSGRPCPCCFRVPPVPGAPVSVRSIQRVMARYLKAAGITKAYSPHTLRHTFATQLLNAGTALEVVKELMGHRSITLTLRYAQVYDTTKRTQYTQAMAHIEPRQAL